MVQFGDIHVHSQYSHDCRTPLLSIRDKARKFGMTVAITDHNVIGGSLAASRLGMDVIPGIEVTTKSLKDFLVYFYEQDNLVEFYEKYVEPAKDPGRIWGSRTTLTEQELMDALQGYDKFVSLAHPYCPMPKRSAALPARIMRRVDAIEVMNHSMSPRANQKAALLCDSLRKVHTAGSDSHHISTLGAVQMRGYGETPSEFLAEIKQGTTMVIGAPRRKRDVMDKVREFVALKVQG